MEVFMKHLVFFVIFLTLAIGVEAASFDCGKASTPVEKSICANTKLSELDSQLMQSYKKAALLKNEWIKRHEG
jgi:uncharacterized protein